MARPTDHQLDLEVAMMLRVGVSLAAAIVLVGGVMLLVRGQKVPDYAHFHGATSHLRTLPGIWQEVTELRPRGLIQLGLVVLIATPVARVVLCLVGFARQRNGLYVVVSAVVLGILVYSLVKGGS